MDTKPQKGEIYTHWKDNTKEYKVFDVALSQMDSYDLMPMVIYKHLYEIGDVDTEYWVRPLEDFLGQVEYSDGTLGPRFVKKHNN